MPEGAHIELPDIDRSGIEIYENECIASSHIPLQLTDDVKNDDNNEIDRSALNNPKDILSKFKIYEFECKVTEMNVSHECNCHENIRSVNESRAQKLVRIEAELLSLQDSPEVFTLSSKLQQLKASIPFLQSMPSSITSSLSSTTDMVKLEERISALEKAMGSHHIDIPSAISALEQKIASLDIVQIDALLARISTINKLNDQLSQKSSPNSSIHHALAINDLEKKLEIVPRLVDRLSALKELHDKALSFATRISQYTAMNEIIQQQTNQHKAILDKLASIIEQDKEIFNRNMQALDNRIKKFKNHNML